MNGLGWRGVPGASAETTIHMCTPTQRGAHSCGAAEALSLCISEAPDVQLNDGIGVSNTAPMHFAAAAGASGRRLSVLARCLHGPFVSPGHLSVITVLLRFGADADCADTDGRTALHMAVSNGHAALITPLVAAGADPNAPTVDGLTPLHIAVRPAPARSLAIVSPTYLPPTGPTWRARVR